MPGWDKAGNREHPTFEGFIRKHGVDAARQVSKYFGGHRVYIPKKNQLAVRERNAFLKALYHQVPHFTYADLRTIVHLARGEQLSLRQIRRIVNS